MAEMRRVRLSEGAKNRVHGQVTATYNFDNHQYVLVGNEVLAVPLNVANAWVAANTNVTIMPER